MNLTPVVITDFLLSIFFLIGGLMSLKTPQNIKTKTIKFLKALWIIFALYFFLEAISFLYLDLFWGRIYGILGFVAMAFLLIAINYNYKDRFISVWLLIVIALGTIATYLAFTQPNAAKIALINGYYQVIWTGNFDILATNILPVLAIVYFIWILLTLFYSPYILRKYAIYYFIGGVIGMLLSVLIYYILKSLLWTEISLCIGLLILNYTVYKEPGILYVLPFKAYRLTVLNKNGDILLKYVWSRTAAIDKIYDLLMDCKSENLERIKMNLYLSTKNIDKLSIKSRLNRFIKQIKIPKDLKIINGRNSENFIFEMKFPEIILYESKYHIVKFEVSKITHFLKDLIIQFSNEFEIDFREELEKNIVDKEKFERGYQLISNFFCMFPSNIITSPKNSLLVSSDSFQIDDELEKRIRELFPDEDDFNFIKCELQRAPENTTKIVNQLWQYTQKKEKKHVEEFGY